MLTDQVRTGVALRQCREARRRLQQAAQPVVGTLGADLDLGGKRESHSYLPCSSMLFIGGPCSARLVHTSQLGGAREPARPSAFPNRWLRRSRSLDAPFHPTAASERDCQVSYTDQLIRCSAWPRTEASADASDPTDPRHAASGSRHAGSTSPRVPFWRAVAPSGLMLRSCSRSLLPLSSLHPHLCRPAMPHAVALLSTSSQPPPPPQAGAPPPTTVSPKQRAARNLARRQAVARDLRTYVSFPQSGSSPRQGGRARASASSSSLGLASSDGGLGKQI